MCNGLLRSKTCNAVQDVLLHAVFYVCATSISTLILASLSSVFIIVTRSISVSIQRTISACEIIFEMYVKKWLLFKILYDILARRVAA